MQEAWKPLSIWNNNDYGTKGFGKWSCRSAPVFCDPCLKLVSLLSFSSLSRVWLFCWRDEISRLCEQKISVNQDDGPERSDRAKWNNSIFFIVTELISKGEKWQSARRSTVLIHSINLFDYYVGKKIIHVNIALPQYARVWHENTYARYNPNMLECDTRKRMPGITASTLM